MTLKLFSLFSGIGGLDLAARWAGIETVGFCEIDPFCRRVLAKHWPGVWIHDDVRALTGELVRERCGRVGIVAGGFQCQDISNAGPKGGLKGETRSGTTWREMLRLVREVRPRWALVENPPALRVRGLDAVCVGLEEAGYTVLPPLTLGSWAVGAPHYRDRVFILAHSDRDGREWAQLSDFARQDLSVSAGGASVLTDPLRPRLQGCWTAAQADFGAGLDDRFAFSWSGEWQLSAPVLCRVDDGIPERVDRTRALGNSADPRVAYPIFEAIARLEANASPLN